MGRPPWSLVTRMFDALPLGRVAGALAALVRARSLTARLIISLLAVVIPLNGLIVAVMLYLTEATREAQRTSLLYSARSIGAGLDATVGKFQALAEALARSPAVLADDPTAFAAEARRAFEGIRGAWVLLADLDDNQLVHTREPPGAVLPVRHSAGIAAQRRAFETRRPVLSGIRVGPVLSTNVVSLDVPVFKNDQPFRSIAVAITPEVFLPLLSASEMPRSWLTGIIDDQGRYVARVPDHAATVGQPASDGWRSSAGREGVFEFVSREGEPIINANDVSAIGGWTVGAAIKKSELEAASWRAVRWLVIGSMLIALGSLVLATMLARRIGRDVKAVGDNAVALLTGGVKQESAVDLPELAALKDGIAEAAGARNRIEAELARRHTELAAIYDSAQVGLCVFDRELRFVRINRRLAEINGLPPEAHIGRTVREIVPALADTAERLAAQVLSTGRGVTDFEISGTTAAEPGRRRTWSEQWMPLKDANGSIIGLNVAVEEITARKDAEARLAQQADRQRRLLDVTHALISRARDESEVAAIVCEAIGPALDADVCLNYKVDRSGKGLDLIFARGMPPDAEAALRRLNIGQAFCGTVADDGIAIAADAERIASDPKGAHLSRRGLTAYLCQPLLGVDGRRLGTFSVGSAGRDRYETEDVDFLQTVANFMAEAWQRIESSRRVAESERLLRSVLDGTLAFIGVLDPDGTLREANLPALLAGNLTRADVVGRKFWDCFWWSYSPQEMSRLRDAVVRAASGEVVRYDAVVRMKDDTRMTIAFMLSPVTDSEGRVVLLVSSGFDISERKSAEDRQRVLMGELGHRGKNLIAVIQSIAGRTLAEAGSTEDAREVLFGRLKALATTFATLTEDGSPLTRLRAILENELNAFGAQSEISGPDVFVSGNAVQTLALVIHELATNAAKYGALSVPGGRIDVGWNIHADGAEPRLTFTWRETGGPPPQTAARSGFGTALIRQIAGAEFQCTPELTFEHSGLVYRFTAPLAAFGAPNAETSGHDSGCTATTAGGTQASAPGGSP